MSEQETPLYPTDPTDEPVPGQQSDPTVEDDDGEADPEPAPPEDTEPEAADDTPA